MKHTKILILIFTGVLASCQDASKSFSFNSGITNNNLILKNTYDYKENINLDSLGTQKILVIPCQFAEERDFNQEMLDKIELAFFSSELSNKGKNYYSLNEYYCKSSKEKLKLEGEVTDVLQIPYTLNEVLEDGSYMPGVFANVFMQKEDNIQYLKNYDSNLDGYVDSVCFIYSSPTNQLNNLWSWVATFDTKPNIEQPTFKRHMWCGIDTFQSNLYDIDAHTIIHETGHLLGLKDYYPSDNYEIALGGHSMMDYNISDHDPYSKMLLSWVDPLYYDFKKQKEITINLKSFQQSNEVLLLNVNWNHSVMDEYLLVEFYTPDGLNYLDAKNQYPNRPIGFTKPGIKIYQVDSRIAKSKLNLSTNKLEFVEYVEEIPNESDEYYYTIGASNNISDSITDSSRQGRYKQIQLIENKDFNNLQSGMTADDDSLFYENDVFNSNDSIYIRNGSFNNSQKINFEIIIEGINSNYATLKIKYLGG